MRNAKLLNMRNLPSSIRHIFFSGDICEETRGATWPGHPSCSDGPSPEYLRGSIPKYARDFTGARIVSQRAEIFPHADTAITGQRRGRNQKGEDYAPMALSNNDITRAGQTQEQRFSPKTCHARCTLCVWEMWSGSNKRKYKVTKRFQIHENM